MGFDWIKGTVLLIVVAAWIIRALAKKPQDLQRMRGSKGPEEESDQDRPAPKRRRTASEVDKFLEEVRRRRESLEGRRRPPQPPPVRLPPVTPAAEVRPARRQLQPPPLPPVPKIPEAPPEPARPLPEVFVAPEIVPEIPLAILGTPLRPATSGPVSPAPSARLRQTLDFLKNRQGMVAAVLLQEVLQRPVSMRTGKIPAYRK